MSNKINQNLVNKFKEGLTIKSDLLAQQLTLASSYGVFSPKNIDSGTELLAKYLTYNIDDISLDLGCGYGVIGLSLAKETPKGQVYLVDKDFIAIKLTNNNIQINNITNATALLSDGFSDIADDIIFDNIISNMPAKVGGEQMAIFLFDAYNHMKAGSKITIVTINGLRNYIKRNFYDVFGNYKKLKQGKNYTVSQAIKQ